MSTSEAQAKIRLTEKEIDVIRATTCRLLGEGSRIRLFGSRARADEKRYFLEASEQQGPPMRLSPTERQAISQAIRQVDAEARIYLHGSRVDDHAKGGDIDLLVLSPKIDLMAKLDILGRLHQQLGERRIDLSVYCDATAPFARHAIQNGTPL